MGSLEREPTRPIEGYLDAGERLRTVHERERERSVEDLCSALRVSVKTLLLSREIVVLPENLNCYPSLAKLIR